MSKEGFSVPPESAGRVVVETQEGVPSKGWRHPAFMCVLVCGGRDYAGAAQVFDVLDSILKQTPPGALLILQGGASGADAIARQWCQRRLVDYRNYPAEWSKHGKAAGPIRNQRMLDHGKPQMVIAFPGGKGTADMVARAKTAGVPVFDGASYSATTTLSAPQEEQKPSPPSSPKGTT